MNKNRELAYKLLKKIHSFFKKDQINNYCKVRRKPEYGNQRMTMFPENQHGQQYQKLQWNKLN